MQKNSIQKKDIILIVLIIISLLFLAFLIKYTIKFVYNKYIEDKCINSVLKFSEANEKSIFTIDKIVYFSSCDGQTQINNNSSFVISDLYQYTDIAIFINNKNYTDDLIAENTLKHVSIDNINFSLSPSVGTPNLYYKNINDFASSKYNTDNIITSSLSFNTTSDNELDFESPVLYNNCANPICITYVNEQIKKDYTLKNTISNVSYNGLLLKYCNVTLNSIACQINMTINITNNLDETFSCPITLSIPLSTENSTIYDGSLTLKHSTNYKFIKNIQ